MTGNAHLQLAIQKLGSAVEGSNTLLSCAEALHNLISAAGICSLDPAVCADAQRLLFAVAPRLAAATAGRLAPEHVFHTLGCASAALSCTSADRYVWLLASVRVLESELRALHLRDMIVTCDYADLAQAIARNPLAAVAFQDGPITRH